MRALFRHPNIRTIMITVTVIIIWHLIAYFIDFNGWIRGNPVARIASNSLGVLLFGAVGLAGLFAPAISQDDMRPLFYRLLGVTFLSIAAVFAWALITGQLAMDMLS